MTQAPRPRKRYKATLAEWEWFRTWFTLERCWVCDNPWQELHHILPRSHSGDDDIANLAPVCREDHAKIEARDPHARSQIRLALLPSNYDYLSSKLGDRSEGWIERNYPVVLEPYARDSRVRDEELTTTPDNQTTTPYFEVRSC